MGNKPYLYSFTAFGLCLFVCVSVCPAGTWAPPAGSELYWCDYFNWWLNDGPPTSTDPVLINTTPEGPAVIDVACQAEAASMIISQFNNPAAVKVSPGGSLAVYGDTTLGNYSATGTLDVSGYVSIDGKLSVGYYISPRGYGVVNLHSGVIAVGGNVIVGEQGGDGTIDMTGGTFDITGNLQMLNGRIRLYDGVIYAANLSFFPPNGTFDIRGDGTLVLWQNLEGVIGHSISSITACGGQGTVIIDYYSGATVVRTECDCPAGDITGDCFVDMEDLAGLAGQWLAGAN